MPRFISNDSDIEIADDVIAWSQKASPSETGNFLLHLSANTTLVELEQLLSRTTFRPSSLGIRSRNHALAAVMDVSALQQLMTIGGALVRGIKFDIQYSTEQKRKKHPGSAWIDANFDRLPPGKWIAAAGNGIVAEGETNEELIKKLTTMGANLNDLAIFEVPQSVGPTLRRQ